MASLGCVVSWPVTGEVESRVLEALAATGTCTTEQLTRALGLTTSTVHASLVRLVQSGLVHAEDGRVSLTTLGMTRAGEVADAVDGSPAVPVTIDLAEIGRAVSALWTTSTSAPSPRGVAAGTRRLELLASDADRDAAVHLLADALSTGRITPAEFDDRADRALTARTYGELDTVLHGLGGLPLPGAPGRPWHKAVFWVVAVLSSPFVFLGAMFTAFADKGDELVFGLVLLALTLPGLFGLWRWAWPRR